jgi:hypothetical protein
MSGERLEVSVSFDEHRGYVAKSACRGHSQPPDFAGCEENCA